MNPLFESYKKSSSQSPLGFDLNTALRNMAAQVIPTGLTPEQIVRQKIQNGEMSQAQFETYSRMADQIIGRRH